MDLHTCITDCSNYAPKIYITNKYVIQHDVCKIEQIISMLYVKRLQSEIVLGNDILLYKHPSCSPCQKQDFICS